MRWLDGIIDSMDMEFEQTAGNCEGREAWHADYTRNTALLEFTAFKWLFVSILKPSLKVEEKSRPLMRVIAGGHRAGKCETKYLQSSVHSFSLLFPSPHPLFFTPLSPTLSANAQSAKGMYDIDWLKLDQKTIYISTTFNPHLKSSIF